MSLLYNLVSNFGIFLALLCPTIVNVSGKIYSSIDFDSTIATKKIHKWQYDLDFFNVVLMVFRIIACVLLCL